MIKLNLIINSISYLSKAYQVDWRVFYEELENKFLGIV
jgi:hypothetical protein